MKVFAGHSNPELATRICQYLGLDLGRADVHRFPNGEIGVKVEEDVRGHDCFLLQSTCPPVNENLMELLLMGDCLRRASASRITAVIPYFGYARQDRKDEGRVPISAKLVANLITTAGINRVVSVDLHASQIQGFFDIPMDHLYAAPVLHAHIERMGLDDFVVCAELGGLKMARNHARRMGVEMVIYEKERLTPREVRIRNVIGSVEGKNVLMIDDVISTGSSVAEAAKELQERGAKKIFLAATHGEFPESAFERLRSSPLEGILVTDTIPVPPEAAKSRIKVVTVARLLGEAMRRIHSNQSVSVLFGYNESPAAREV